MYKKGKMKSRMDTHKEKPFVCTQCDYTCPEKKKHENTYGHTQGEK